MVPGDENPTALAQAFDQAIAETRQTLLSPLAIGRLLREPHVAERFHAFVQRTSEDFEPVAARDSLPWEAALSAVRSTADSASVGGPVVAGGRELHSNHVDVYCVT